MRRSVHDALADLASRQHGQFSIWQAREIGITDTDVQRLMGRGEVVRVRPSVYRFAGVPVDWRTELHADVLAAPRGAWAAQSAALRLYGVTTPLLPYRREILTLGTGLVHVDDDVAVHRTRRIDPQDIRIEQPVPATSRARTLVDITPTLDWWDALNVLDLVVCESPGSRPTIYRTAVRLRHGRAGVSRIVRATAPDAEANFRSWLERQAAPIVARAGLSDARWNVRVPGIPGIVDTYSHDCRLAIEWKGLAFHRRPDQLQRDADKQNAAAAVGVVTLSFTWTDVVTREDHVAGLLAHARSRRDAGDVPPDPPCPLATTPRQP